jgi:hypothetical protein
MSRDTPPLPNTPSWRGAQLKSQGQLYLLPMPQEHIKTYMKFTVKYFRNSDEILNNQFSVTYASNLRTHKSGPGPLISC